MRIKIDIGFTIFTALFIVFYCFTHTNEYMIMRLSNAFFLAGILNLSLGLCCHIRNGRLFGSFSYMKFKRYRKKMRESVESGELPKNTKIMDFYEYLDDKYSVSWNPVPNYLLGGPLVILSIILSFFLY